MNIELTPYDLNFKFHAGTSRGWLKTKRSYICKIRDEGIDSYGECSLIPKLSPDDMTYIDEWLHDSTVLHSMYLTGTLLEISPAMNFAIEMALKAQEEDSALLKFKNDFSAGKTGIPINGLIWMGDFERMLKAIHSKIEQGFRCVKIKVGAIEFEKELELLCLIREKFGDGLILRLDANGAFLAEKARTKLRKLAKFNIHSIEQPIAPNQWNEMRALCEDNIIPIALDEELIGHYTLRSRLDMLETIQPQYIILKPSLVGGLNASSEWIELASSMNIDYWITSALESNIGLNAIAQWTAQNNIHGYQGLGTGGLFDNNFESPLRIVGEELYYGGTPWQMNSIEKLFRL